MMTALGKIIGERVSAFVRHFFLCIRGVVISLFMSILGSLLEQMREEFGSQRNKLVEFVHTFARIG